MENRLEKLRCNVIGEDETKGQLTPLNYGLQERLIWKKRLMERPGTTTDFPNCPQYSDARHLEY